MDNIRQQMIICRKEEEEFNDKHKQMVFQRRDSEKTNRRPQDTRTTAVHNHSSRFNSLDYLSSMWIH
ncbi:hypothetical protein BLOT_003931 [Blomia tropicalis]|nr:hypothetical protein BLOT_003931 [Blomia tropicalis]